MDRARFSNIAHADHVFANPLGEEKIERLLALMALRPGASVLDVGCGNAELLRRLAERYSARGVGVDPNADALAEGRRRMEGQPFTDQIELIAARAEDYAPDRVFDAALSIGASHAYGGFAPTLRALRALVRPGGHILIGEGYWKQPPEQGYLRLLDAEPDELTSHMENVERAQNLGLTFLYAAVSSDDDWDHYEGLYCRAAERYVAAHPDDPESDEYRAYIRRWYAGYLRWGRATLGFGLYLLRV